MLLGKTGLTIDDFGLYEVNEAFAPVPLAWAKAVGADESKLNVNGGAMALGHPLGGECCGWGGAGAQGSSVSHTQYENMSAIMCRA